MEFFAVNGKRPVRLSESTRVFAYKSLNHKYGQEARQTPAVSMDDLQGFEALTLMQKHDEMIARIAKTAPIRICEGERISGAATLGKAIDHQIPANFLGETVFDSISHLTIDFETVLKKGVNDIQKRAEEAYLKYKGTEKEAFIVSCLHCLNCMKVWHARYLEALRDKPQYRDNYNNLQKVPFAPAENFYEAVQSIWFTFAFVRLCGNWPGIGRIDWLLGDYLEKDLAEGRITLEEAREILAHFFIKGCEWITGEECGSGDAQHYQNILLAGVDENGIEVTNQVTYLVLDILEELSISDFPTTVRINQHTPEKLLRRIAEVIRYGGGVLAVYNEDLILESLVDYGYELSEARKFANDGCWEVQIPGKTNFSYLPFDALVVLQSKTLNKYSGKTYDTFEELYQAYICDLTEQVQKTKQDVYQRFLCNLDQPRTLWKWKEAAPCTVVSLFEGGCIENGLSYREGGPVYQVASPHIGGLPDVTNSLYAIKKLVFDDKKVTFQELMAALRNNWKGNELLRQLALNKYAYYGNDNDEVDLIAARIVEDFAAACDLDSQGVPIKTPAGISTFGRQLEWSPHRFATPYGKKAHEVLAGNFSPTPGTDREGATAIIKSYCKANLKRMVTGAALDIKLLPTVVNTDAGIAAIVSLIKGFAILGGHFMQLDIADTELLKAAQEHPEDYQNLSVRVSGWNARFVTLNKQWQDMVIAQTGSGF